MKPQKDVAIKGFTTSRVKLATTGLVTIDAPHADEVIAQQATGKIVRVALAGDIEDDQAARVELAVRAVARGVKVLPRPKASLTPERAHRETMPALTPRAVCIEMLDAGAYRDNEELRAFVLEILDEEGIA